MGLHTVRESELEIGGGLLGMVEGRLGGRIGWTLLLGIINFFYVIYISIVHNFFIFYLFVVPFLYV